MELPNQTASPTQVAPAGQADGGGQPVAGPSVASGTDPMHGLTGNAAWPSPQSRGPPAVSQVQLLCQTVKLYSTIPYIAGSMLLATVQSDLSTHILAVLGDSELQACNAVHLHMWNSTQKRPSVRCFGLAANLGMGFTKPSAPCRHPWNGSRA
jgi:hypothetical protein